MQQCSLLIPQFMGPVVGKIGHQTKTNDSRRKELTQASWWLWRPSGPQCLASQGQLCPERRPQTEGPAGQSTEIQPVMSPMKKLKKHLRTKWKKNQVHLSYPYIGFERGSPWMKLGPHFPQEYNFSKQSPTYYNKHNNIHVLLIYFFLYIFFFLLFFSLKTASIFQSNYSFLLKAAFPMFERLVCLLMNKWNPIPGDRRWLVNSSTLPTGAQMPTKKSWVFGKAGGLIRAG